MNDKVLGSNMVTKFMVGAVLPATACFFIMIEGIGSATLMVMTETVMKENEEQKIKP